MADQTDLTKEQEAKMLAFWNLTPSNPPSIDAIAKHVFDDPSLDGRTNEAKMIKKSLANHNLKAITKTRPDNLPKVSEIELTEDHKEFIRNNISTMHCYEIARIIFKNPVLNNLNAETRAIKTWVETNLDSRTVFRPEDDDVPEGDYQPPKRLDACLARVNKYVNTQLDIKKLSADKKRGLEALINYLHTHRFKRQINSYDNDQDRASFEDAFIRYTYDKSDLTQEEVDEFIVLATEVVMGFSIQRRSEALQRQLDDVTGSGEENARISMSLVEAIGKAQGEYNQCVGRQQKLLTSLKQKRSDRISHNISENTFLNFFQLWKMEETRKELIGLAQEEQKEIAEEVDRISKIDAIQARILGISKAEILSG